MSTVKKHPSETTKFPWSALKLHSMEENFRLYLRLFYNRSTLQFKFGTIRKISVDSNFLAQIFKKVCQITPLSMFSLVGYLFIEDLSKRENLFEIKRLVLLLLTNTWLFLSTVRHTMSTWRLFVKIWTVSNCKFNANFFFGFIPLASCSGVS